MTKERLPFKESFPVVTCTSSRSFNLAFRITRVGFLKVLLSLKVKSSVYVWGFCFDCWRVYQQKVHNVFSHGLSDRLKTVCVTWESMLSEPILQNGLLTHNTEPLLIGISVSSSDKAFRIVDIGPDVDK
ncbi:hypothetical protein RchiOBHm_Chr5g0064711 [Rosa chinensis]|uniref:Nrap protein domain-containing protein n=1 Tax=Rosa chinensis TaxID=74649 RepID=A0A2P6QIQ4_ROSCH|nr:hypothetical protein RchiOBHm_Chr5g0064711 [Rosa chinensis]